MLKKLWEFFFGKPKNNNPPLPLWHTLKRKKRVNVSIHQAREMQSMFAAGFDCQGIADITGWNVRTVQKHIKPVRPVKY